MRLNSVLLSSVMAAVLISGCATVDMTEMAMPSAAKTEASTDKNVVQRAAAKLYAAFASKGFVAKTSQKRVQSAASILLNGLEDRELTDAETDYAAQGLPASVVQADILYATQHVRQTTKAAEVYLEIAEDDTDLRKELKSLEQAILAAREASDAFGKSVAGEDADLVNLRAEIAALTRVTDRFGDRVRRAAAADMAARRAASQS